MGQQAKLMPVHQARQQRHLDQAKSNNREGRHRGPFGSANGFFSQAHGLSLVRGFIHKAFKDGEKNNADIEPQAPFADIFQVELDTLFHFFQSIGFAAPAVNLRPAGDARFDLMPQHVAFDQFAILFVMGHGMRTRADNRHTAGQDIDKLGQLIQRGAAQEVADGGHARIVLRGLGHHSRVFHDFHGAEFPHHDGLAVHTVTGLAEYHRSF
ncbi:Uncharacterised protein [Atlantibacter hermannii]|nr:Uncharacterised protein [Atlantibacter hermannii]